MITIWVKIKGWGKSKRNKRIHLYHKRLETMPERFRPKIEIAFDKPNEL